MPSRLQIAKPDIVKAFSQGPAVLRPSDLVKIFNEERASWRLAQRTTLHEFVDFLVGKTELRRITLAFPSRASLATRGARCPFWRRYSGW